MASLGELGGARSHELPEDRKARLDELGFIWSAREAYCETMFAELKRYRDKHGHCNVPAIWTECPKLGRWVTVQRVRKERGTISVEQVARLDALENELVDDAGLAYGP